MKRLTTLAMVLAAASALSASAQIAPLDRAKEAAAQSTAASRGTAEQQHAVNMQDSKPAPPPSQAVTGNAMSPAKGGAAKAAPAAKKGKVPTPAEIKKLADKQEATGAKSAAPEMAKSPAQEKRRDPFVSPIVRAVSTGPTQTCSGGKHCLSPDDITVRGIVKSQNGWIAVVENSAKRTFFLHEKDEIFNAVIEKITQDSLVIREQTFDNLGKQITHEVVKRLPA